MKYTCPSPSAGGRGLKYLLKICTMQPLEVALRGRAWIEISIRAGTAVQTMSPSAGGRGLKYITLRTASIWKRRPPREGVD